jgi:hypothetical protein
VEAWSLRTREHLNMRTGEEAFEPHLAKSQPGVLTQKKRPGLAEGATPPPLYTGVGRLPLRILFEYLLEFPLLPLASCISQHFSA